MIGKVRSFKEKGTQVGSPLASPFILDSDARHELPIE